MTISEMKDYYTKLGNSYYQEAQNLRQRGNTAEENKQFSKASNFYSLSTEKSKKAYLCWDFVTNLARYEIAEALTK